MKRQLLNWEVMELLRDYWKFGSVHYNLLHKYNYSISEMDFSGSLLEIRSDIIALYEKNIMNINK